MVQKNSQPTVTALASFKYGMPAFGLAWPEGDTFYVSGGGGASKSGIKNRVIAAHRVQGMVTDVQADCEFDMNCPMRIAVTPNGKSLAVALAQGGVKRVDIDSKGRSIKLHVATGDVAARLMEEKGEVRAICFSPQGDHLVLGGEDGSLRVLTWPSLDTRLHLKGEAKLPDSIRDITASKTASRGVRVAAVLDNGNLEIWDCDSKQAVCKARLLKGDGPLYTSTTLQMEGPNITATHQLPTRMAGAKFAIVRYAPAAPQPPGQAGQPTPPATSSSSDPILLHAVMNTREASWLVTWVQDPSTGMLSMLRHTYIIGEACVTLDVSRCGQLLAVGSTNSTIKILRAWDLSVVRTRPAAHSVFCTAVVFSPDSRHVLSVSADASATLTPTDPDPGLALTVPKILVRIFLVLGLLLALLAFVVKLLKDSGNQEAVDKIGAVLNKIVPLFPPSRA